MSNVSNVSSTNQIETEDLTINGSMSISLKFAQLQMKQAASAKKKAQDYMNQIEDSQKEQKEIADMIAEARKLQNEAKANGGTTVMPKTMKEFFQKNGLSWESTGKDDKYNNDQWDYNIKSLTNFQETKSNNTQTLMVYVQDFIGQYNTYTQGAMSAISEAKQAFQAILNKV